jgi:hypothetical protein
LVRAGSSLVTALRVTLARPSTWPLALGAFLLRGGFVLVLIPIVVVPTPVGIGNLVAPAANAISLGAVPIGFVLACVGIGLGVVLWLGLAGWLAGLLEAAAIGIVARERASAAAGVAGGLSAPVDDQPRPSDAGRILACRLACLAPLAIAVALGAVRLVFVTYQELTLPSDTATPIVIRVLHDAPDVPIAIVVIWMSGEILAAVAARRVVLAGEGVRAALRSALGLVVRRPLAALLRFWLPTIVLAVVIVAAALTSSAAWSAVKASVASSADPLATMVTTVVFVALWLAGLALIALVSAWRAAAWTVAAPGPAGTFGGSTDRRPGDWRPDPRSATL